MRDRVILVIKLSIAYIFLLRGLNDAVYVFNNFIPNVHIGVTTNGRHFAHIIVSHM